MHLSAAHSFVAPGNELQRCATKHANKSIRSSQKDDHPHGRVQHSAPRPPSFEENLNELGPPLASPRMPTLVIVDAESVGVCATLRNLCESLRRVDFVSVAAHASPAAKISTAVAPASARSAPLDHVLVTIGLFVGQRGRSLWSPRAAPHVICVTRDSERAATLKAMFLYTDVRRTGATFRHATGQKDAVKALREATQRRGVVGAVFCAGWKTTLWCGRTARTLSAWAYPRLLTLRKRAGVVPGLRGGRRRARGPPGVSAFPRRRRLCGGPVRRDLAPVCACV